MNNMTSSAVRQNVGLFSFNRIRPLLSSALDLLYPPCCTHCERVDARFCDLCWRDLENEPLAPQRSRLESGLQVIITGSHRGILQSAVQALKYNQATRLAHPLSQRVYRLIGKQMQSIDMIIPVPIHTQRLRERGYNQAKLIAEVLADMSQTPCIPQALIRQRDTRTQVGLSDVERLQNVAGAFSADPQFVKGKRVLLLDDVKTTGATLDASADALRKAGTRAMIAVTITGS